MKFSTSVSIFFLCFMFGVTETSASGWSGISSIFGNLMFSLNLCNLGQSNCTPGCHGPLKSHMCQYMCSSGSSSSDRRLTSGTYSSSACESLYDSGTSAYTTCVAGASTCNTENGDVDVNAEYSQYEESNAGESNISSGTGKSSRLSLLPYIIAAAVAAMFSGLFIWKKKRDRDAKEQEDLLADDSFHGSIAKRISNKLSRKKSASAAQSNGATSFVKTTGYALA